MRQISSTFSATRPTPRIANYVAALIREGDNFDYCEWLQRVREKEAQAKELRQAIPERISSKEMGVAVSTLRDRETSPTGRLFNGRVPVPIRMIRSRRKNLHSSSVARIRRRFDEIRDAWNDFQGRRARDAGYGYLGVVFAIVAHYKVRRKTKKLLRRAFEFADLPFDKNADPFTAIIRCTCGDAADNKTISRWARALRYVAHCKVPRTQLRMFMKQAGGINACADRYAEYLGRGTR
jgi:hypothetical protein